MVTLENDHLRVSISTKGAEITSIYNKISRLEHIWQADPEVWPWHAPNLFPVVGGLLNDQLQVDDAAFPMKRHGFARHMDFSVMESTSTHAEFSLAHNEETLKSFPYKFQFQLIYDLSENQLRVTYKVINEDFRDIYFAVGAHPAFNVPFHPAEQYEDYYLEFDKEEELETHLLSSEGYFNGEKETVDTEGRILPLSRRMFDQDALVFKTLQSRTVWLKSRNRSQYLEVSFPHFNYLGLWAKPGASFLCIEPWIGCADSVGEPVDVSSKEGIRKLEQGHVFEVEMIIGVYQS
ncbi:MAG TPA: aldose 1-epimerase family protein [Sphingobacteriaceae bacterium]